MSDTQASTTSLRFTLWAYGRSATFGARTVDQLARRIYTRTHWQESECTRLARELMRGRVVMAPDYETAVFPGELEVHTGRPLERDMAAW